MHPTSAFHWDDRGAMLAFVRARSFGTLVDGALRVAQAPVVVDEAAGTLLLHLSRANAVARNLPARVVAVFGGADAYVSPDWYASEEQVPTWNYESVEIVGTLTAMDDGAVPDLLARLSAEHETRIEGKRPWTLDKLAPETLATLRRAIVGVTLTIETLRGTRKLSQNKTPADVDGAVAGLRGRGTPREAELAGRMAAARPFGSEKRREAGE